MHTRADCSTISHKRCFKSIIQNEEIEVCSEQGALCPYCTVAAAAAAADARGREWWRKRGCGGKGDSWPTTTRADQYRSVAAVVFLKPSSQNRIYLQRPNFRVCLNKNVESATLT